MEDSPDKARPSGCRGTPPIEEELQQFLQGIPAEARDVAQLAFLAIQSEIEALKGTFCLRIARAPVSERVQLVEQFAYEDWELGVKHLLPFRALGATAFGAALEQLREATLANLIQLTAKVREPKRSKLLARVAVELRGRGQMILSQMHLAEAKARWEQLRAPHKLLTIERDPALARSPDPGPQPGVEANASVAPGEIEAEAREKKRGARPISELEAQQVAEIVNRVAPDGGLNARVNELSIALCHGVCDADDPDTCDIEDHPKIPPREAGRSKAIIGLTRQTTPLY